MSGRSAVNGPRSRSARVADRSRDPKPSSALSTQEASPVLLSPNSPPAAGGAVGLAEAVWHERLRRQMHPENFDARHRLLVHELLGIASGRPVRLEAIVDGICRWQPMPPERGTPEFIERETRRVWDEIGTLLGIGPKP